MIDAQYFDEEPADAGVEDGAVQEMARRQLGFSLVVAFALLAVAGLVAVRGSHEETIAAMAAPHRIAGVQAPQMVTPAVAMNKE
jgi:hypothetical protein